MKHPLWIAGCLLLSSLLQAAPLQLLPPVQPDKVEDLSHWSKQADLIAVVQVIDTEYRKVRGMPVEGFARLEVLISYRMPKALKDKPFIEVHAKGFGYDQCYYPEFANEGARLLVFLQVDDKGKIRGMRPSCALPVYVTQNSGYALLYPIGGLEITNMQLVKDCIFTDPYAWQPMEMLTSQQIERLVDEYAIEIDSANQRYRPTLCIDLTDVREQLLKLEETEKARREAVENTDP